VKDLRYCIGIDPGLDGAVAILCGRSVEVFDTPTFKLKEKRYYDTQGMTRILSDYQVRGAIVAIERISAMRGWGISTCFKLGMGYGIWIGILAALRFDVKTVSPQVWKRAMLNETEKDKKAALEVARLTYPNVDLHLQSHDGRADALLIARYAQKLL
jgi:hypothetical protein